MGAADPAVGIVALLCALLAVHRRPRRLELSRAAACRFRLITGRAGIALGWPAS
jgi:hypothetical protein